MSALGQKRTKTYGLMHFNLRGDVPPRNEYIKTASSCVGTHMT
jgi:hypothetical protein